MQKKNLWNQTEGKKIFGRKFKKIPQKFSVCEKEFYQKTEKFKTLIQVLRNRIFFIKKFNLLNEKQTSTKNYFR